MSNLTVKLDDMEMLEYLRERFSLPDDLLNKIIDKMISGDKKGMQDLIKIHFNK